MRKEGKKVNVKRVRRDLNQVYAVKAMHDLIKKYIYIKKAILFLTRSNAGKVALTCSVYKAAQGAWLHNQNNIRTGDRNTYVEMPCVKGSIQINEIYLH